MEIKPKEIKPEFVGRVQTVGESVGTTIPIDIVRTFCLEKGKKYKFIILEEISNGPFVLSQLHLTDFSLYA